MPEIAEAARIVHFLRTHLVGKKIYKAVAIDDASVFGKAGTSGEAIAEHLTGNTVVSAGSQGKYFWLILECPPHPLMHFGMTGWIHIKGIRTGYTSFYNKMKPGEADVWPPKYWKFKLETDSKPKVELAFTDPRRFGRVRLIDCPGHDIRNVSPLVENGPDPVVDAAIFTEELVRSTLRKRHVPIKALLLDQTFISGIGNWVGDEVLFQARLHPEQYCDDFSDAEIKRLHAAICNVCRTAVGLLGVSEKFPDDWLFRHRWGKGKGTETRLPSGEKLAFVTVGGRTSCYAPSLQKKSGAVAPGAKEEPATVTANKKKEAGTAKAAARTTKSESRKRGAAEEPEEPGEPGESGEPEEAKKPGEPEEAKKPKEPEEAKKADKVAKTAKTAKASKTTVPKKTPTKETMVADPTKFAAPSKKRKAAEPAPLMVKSKEKKQKNGMATETLATGGRRRSTRLSEK